MPGITAVVCAQNRAYSLRDSLQSLADQLPHGTHPLEIIVIDTPSGDASSVVGDFTHSPWPVRRVIEPRQGEAFARNRGLSEAAGEYVAFLGEGAIAAQDWIKTLVSSFEQSGADLVAGRIAGDPAQTIDFANAGLRVAATERFGGFDTGFGAEKDADFCRRWQRRGAKMAFEPGAVVRKAATGDERRATSDRVGLGERTA